LVIYDLLTRHYESQMKFEVQPLLRGPLRLCVSMVNGATHRRDAEEHREVIRP
jgi:hypothetical protein